MALLHSRLAGIPVAAPHGARPPNSRARPSASSTDRDEIAHDSSPAARSFSSDSLSSPCASGSPPPMAFGRSFLSDVRRALKPLLPFWLRPGPCSDGARTEVSLPCPPCPSRLPQACALVHLPCAQPISISLAEFPGRAPP
ncbi:hypothetical protein Zm00014a_029221 [Zea mays]|uniref:Uncharacterized protein n=1 Tax=Zea mays TaxID=4577 RepID=A0A317YHF6_MAIZE|nr:hypothetical protein Zm00014a_029221 [Zea mays]